MRPTGKKWRNQQAEHGETVTVREVATVEVERDMRGIKAPLPGQYKGQPIRRKVQQSHNGEPIIFITNYQIAHVWDGKAKQFTTYA